MSGGESAKVLLERWQVGDQLAAEELHRRYAQRLWRLAEQQIGRRLGRRVGPDDIVQSVFRTFFRRTARGEYTVDHSGSLWRLLVRITLNKVRRQGVRHHAGRRNISSEVYDEGKQFPEAIARTPSHEEVAALLDELETLLAGLEPPEPEIVRLGLQGYSSPEIATQVGCSRWTVRRVLDRVGARLEQRLQENCES